MQDTFFAMVIVALAILVGGFNLGNIAGVTHHRNHVPFGFGWLYHLLLRQANLFDRVSKNRSETLVSDDRDSINGNDRLFLLSFTGFGLLYFKIVFWLSIVYVIGGCETLIRWRLEPIVISRFDTFIGQVGKGRAELIFSI